MITHTRLGKDLRKECTYLILDMNALRNQSRQTSDPVQKAELSGRADQLDEVYDRIRRYIPKR